MAVGKLLTPTVSVVAVAMDADGWVLRPQRMADHRHSAGYA